MNSKELVFVKEPLLKMYAVRNKEGKFFRSKGYGGSGATWVDGLAKAKIYPRIGQARSRVTFFASTYPQYGVPELVELHVTTIVAVDETDRVQKSIDQKKLQKAKWAAQHAKWQEDDARQKLAEAQQILSRLGKKL